MKMIVQPKQEDFLKSCGGFLRFCLWKKSITPKESIYPKRNQIAYTSLKSLTCQFFFLRWNPYSYQISIWKTNIKMEYKENILGFSLLAFTYTHWSPHLYWLNFRQPSRAQTSSLQQLSPNTKTAILKNWFWDTIFKKVLGEE